MLCPICFQMCTRKRKATTATAFECCNESQPGSSGLSTAKTGPKRQTTGQTENKKKQKSKVLVQLAVTIKQLHKETQKQSQTRKTVTFWAQATYTYLKIGSQGLSLLSTRRPGLVAQEKGTLPLRGKDLARDHSVTFTPWAIQFHHNVDY